MIVLSGLYPICTCLLPCCAGAIALAIANLQTEPPLLRERSLLMTDPEISSKNLII
ncbi:hypothetical protein [Allocoleopsis sp.]|uniref:hypothetical protein n=1 Tax=Allocoleopsis sp. TaxID=3088169 RepID=UPI002FD38BE3